MAKLIIYRGDTLDREIDLPERSSRIGRGDQNDIVLPDPAKSVSRFHAELRFEQGKYVAVDLNSQNGTWVAGRRVPQVVLEPGVPVLMGTYRLMLKPEPPPLPPDISDATLVTARMDATSTAETMVRTATVVPPPRPEPADAGTKPGLPGADTPTSVPVAAPPQADQPATAPPPLVAGPPPLPPPPPPPIVQPAPVAPVAPKVESAPAPPAAAKADAPTSVGRPEPPKVAAKPQPAAPRPEPPKPAPKAEPAGAGPGAPRPATKTAPASLPSAPAAAVKKQGSREILYVGLALVLLVGVGLAAGVYLWPMVKDRIPGMGGGQPTAAATQAGEQPASAPAGQPGAAPVEPAPGPASGAPTETPSASAQPPVEPPSQPPAASPAPVEKAATAPATRATAGQPGTRGTSPAGRRGRETAKPANLAQALDEAKAAMSKGDYLAAIAGFEAILKVEPRYPGAADQLGAARNGAKSASQQAVEAGAKAETNGDLAGARKQYDRALQLDPTSTAASEAIGRLRARAQAEGEDAFRRARQYDALGRVQDAVSMYEKAISLLPSDHASVKVAKERLAALKGGF